MDINELSYIEGRRRTLINLLTHALKELEGFDHEDEAIIKLARAIRERQEAIQTLRSVCLEIMSGQMVYI